MCAVAVSLKYEVDRPDPDVQAAATILNKTYLLQFLRSQVFNKSQILSKKLSHVININSL